MTKVFRSQLACAFFAALQAFSFSSRALTQLTNVSRVDFGDPSLPVFDANGVTVFTTGGLKLTWSSAQDFFAGQNPRIIPLRICHSDGTPIDPAQEDIWDPSIRDGVLYGSLMIPPAGQKTCEWVRDAVTRRTFAFHLTSGCWTSESQPLVSTNPRSWIGHTYGHEFIEDDHHQEWMFYERVSLEKNSVPWITELFVRKLKSDGKLDLTETKIFDLTKKAWPATHRSFGGELAEGPRPFKVNGFYFVSFSSGDFNSDHYGLNLLWSKNVDGPYKPYLNSTQTDLKNFGDEIQKSKPMTWGPGRGSFFSYQGKMWVLFHGIPKPFDSHDPDGHRQLFLTPVSIEFPARSSHKDAAPIVRVKAEADVP